MTSAELRARIDKAERDNTYAHMLNVDSEVRKLLVKREAKRIADDMERAGAAFDPIETIGSSIYATLPDAPPDLIPGVLPSAGAAGIIAETNVGKSLLALEIASSLATGQPLWGSLTPTKRVEKVLYVLGEHNKETVQQLFHLTGLPHEGNIVIVGPKELHRGPGKALVVNGIEQRAAIDRLIKWGEGAGLVIFDPLSGFVQGRDAENDNTVMKTLIGAFSTVAETNGAACLILHHMGKPRLGENGQEQRRTSYASRGASAIEDSLTHAFYLTSEKPNIKQAAEGPNVFRLKSRKFKGQSDAGQFMLMRDAQTKRHSLLTGARPTKEVERIITRHRLDTLSNEHPDWTETQLVEAVADEQKVSSRTIWRHLEN